MKRRTIVGSTVVHNAAAYPGKSPEEKIQRAIAAAAKERPTVWVGTSLLSEANAPIVLTLPEPPSLNTIWRRSGTHIHLSAEAKVYREAVSMLTSRYRNGAEVAFPSGDLALTVLWHRSAKRGDLDNRLKACLDSLKNTVFRDDKQICRILAERCDTHPTLAKGFMRVEIFRWP